MILYIKYKAKKAASNSIKIFKDTLYTFRLKYPTTHSKSDMKMRFNAKLSDGKGVNLICECQGLVLPAGMTTAPTTAEGYP